MFCTGEEGKEQSPPPVSPGVEHVSFYLETGERAVSLLRPGAREFLTAVCREFDVVIFSAGHSRYLRPLLRALLGRRASEKLRTSLRCRKACTPVAGYYMKDLCSLRSDLARTVLVDNCLLSFGPQPHNAIPIRSFYGDEQPQPQPEEEQVEAGKPVVLPPLLPSSRRVPRSTNAAKKKHGGKQQQQEAAEASKKLAKQQQQQSSNRHSGNSGSDSDSSPSAASSQPLPDLPSVLACLRALAPLPDVRPELCRRFALRRTFMRLAASGFSQVSNSTVYF